MAEYTSLSFTVQSAIVWGFALCMLGTLVTTLPVAHLYWGYSPDKGYVEKRTPLDILFNPVGRALLLGSWSSACFWLLIDRHTVLASGVCLLWSRLSFLSLRWRSLSRGMGAPGFMLYWLSALVFFLEYTKFYDSTGQLRQVVILVFKVDFACIMLCAGQYKFFSGYPQNNGMERGLTHPWWGRFPRFYQRFSPSAPLFRLLNHSAYLVELTCGILVLCSPCSETGALLLALSFVFIMANIKLGFLCPTVITCCLLFSQPRGWIDSILSWTNQSSVELPSSTLLAILNGAVGLVLLSYLLLLPFMKMGLYYNFYGKRNLPTKLQSFQNWWTIFWGISIWRVFTVDNTNFYINIFKEDPLTKERSLYSIPGEYSWDKRFRFEHVGEWICLTTLFCTRKYFPKNFQFFEQRLLRYARTIPHLPHQVLVFQWVDLHKDDHAFVHSPSTEFTVDTATKKVLVTILEGHHPQGKTPRFSNLVEGEQLGSYAPLESSDDERD